MLWIVLILVGGLAVSFAMVGWGVKRLMEIFAEMVADRLTDKKSENKK